MSLIDEARTVGAGSSVRPCTLQKLKQSDPEYWDELVAALADDEVKVTWLEEATQNRGKRISETVLGKHRRRQCSLCKDDINQRATS